MGETLNIPYDIKVYLDGKLVDKIIEIEIFPIEVDIEIN